jgi:hypothetical protein
MVKVKAPMMSLSASGALGGALVFSTWKGTPYVRTLVTPTNPKSAAQTAIRAMMKFLSQDWINLSAPEQATWDEVALNDSISPFNAYIRYNLSRWRMYKTPSQELPAAETADARTTTQSLTAGIRNILISNTPSAATDEWGILIMRDAAAITVPNWNLVIAAIKSNGTNAVLYTDAPLVAGTYHYRSATFNDDGDIGVVCADASAAAS